VQDTSTSISNRVREYKRISDAISVHNGEKLTDLLHMYLLVLLTSIAVKEINDIYEDGESVV
jgi:hypothetical protein